jgi:hypothetical protein
VLLIQLKQHEVLDESVNEFHKTKAKSLRLQHSLISISKWESVFYKPLIKGMSDNDLTDKELRGYIGCMIIGEYTQEDITMLLTYHTEEITNHIASPATATTINRPTNNKPNRDIITSEIIYYWMVAFEIPFDCEKWHINKLLTLIDVCNIKNSSDKKANKRDILNNNRSLNEKRRAALGSSG